MWQMILFGVVATGVWTGVHLYIGHRLIHQVGLKEPHRKIAWVVVAMHGLLAPIVNIMRRTQIEGTLYDVTTLVAYVGMGFTATLLVLLLVKDIAHLGIKLAKRLARPAPPPDQDRRNLLAGSFNLSAFAFAGVSSAVGYSNAKSLPEVQDVEVPIEGLPAALDGFSIVQLSDIHIGPTLKRDFLEGVVDRANTLNADLVAITGDIVDGYVADYGDVMAYLKELKAPHGVHFVTGNHEYYWDGPVWAQFIGELGIHVLLNEHRLVEVGGARLLVGGVTDYRAERMVPEHASDPHAAIKGAPTHDMSLLLAHQPTSVYEAQKAGWKLQLSGHTHGGQFFPWNIFVGLYHEFSAGLDRLEDMWIYVSRGAGYWGPPNRFGTKSEITHITLRRA